MINQQLTDFLKSQLQKGVSKETISQELLANGWTTKDINEGFASVPPVPVVLKNLGDIPLNSPQRINVYESSETIQIKSHFGTKLFLIVLLLLILSGGASAYYFKNDLTKIPIIGKFMGNIISVNDASLIPTQTQVQPPELEALSTNKNNLNDIVRDCGASDFTTFSDYNSLYQKDSVVKCIGESVLNNCQNAKALISNPSGSFGTLGTASSATLEVINNNGICSVKVTLDNKYNQCPVSVVKSPIGPDAIFQNPDVSDPAKYAIEIFNYLTTGVILENYTNNPNTSYQIIKDNFTNKGCTGELLPSILQNLQTARLKGTEALIKSIVSTTRPEAELYYEKQPAPGSYKNVCQSTMFKTYIDKLKNSNSIVTCFDSKDSYGISASLLVNNDYFCADSSGFSGNISKKITSSKCQ